MLSFIARRVLFMIPTLITISIVTFTLIHLPPGDFVTSLAASASAAGNTVDPATLAQLRHEYGLDQSILVQYWLWISKIVLHGDFGRSFDWKAPVSDLLWGRLGLTMVLSFTALVVTWLIAFPVGIYSAVRKYSIGDYAATFLSFIGLAIPNFVLALILMYLSLRFFNMSVGGLFSPQYQDAPWSVDKISDLAQHMIIPVIVLSGAGIAAAGAHHARQSAGRTAQAVCRARPRQGPARADADAALPGAGRAQPVHQHRRLGVADLVSGDVIVASVLSLPTIGPILIQALKTQDQYLAGALLLFSASSVDRDAALRPAAGVARSAHPLPLQCTTPTPSDAAAAAGRLAIGSRAVAAWQPGGGSVATARDGERRRIALIYLVAAFCDFVAPFDPFAFTPRYTYAPPQMVHLFHATAAPRRPCQRIQGHIDAEACAAFSLPTRRSNSRSPSSSIAAPIGFSASSRWNTS